MSGNNHKKIPKALAHLHPQESKTPKIQIASIDSCFPDFRACQMDLGGPWGWHDMQPKEIQEVLAKIFTLQKLSWQELRAQHSHLVDVKNIISKAQNRLREIEKDDIDQLFSLRINAKNRLWGIKEGNIFWLLWWDAQHEICPSPKKHT